jgi:hypothetical protein
MTRIGKHEQVLFARGLKYEQVLFARGLKYEFN